MPHLPNDAADELSDPGGSEQHLAMMGSLVIGCDSDKRL
jgi:hypothetical protein